MNLFPTYNIVPSSFPKYWHSLDHRVTKSSLKFLLRGGGRAAEAGVLLRVRSKEGQNVQRDEE